eukprot:COSAG02_NODE_2814_length_7971_cov_4.403455_6_plen_149_part_00
MVLQNPGTQLGTGDERFCNILGPNWEQEIGNFIAWKGLSWEAILASRGSKTLPAGTMVHVDLPVVHLHSRPGHSIAVGVSRRGATPPARYITNARYGAVAHGRMRYVRSRWPARRRARVAPRRAIHRLPRTSQRRVSVAAGPARRGVH